eukprot:1156369-Pelagomonas_calceolata.AAC.10
MQQACAATDGHSVQVVEDISEYKRSCDVWPNVGAYHSSKRKQRELAERRLKAKPQTGLGLCKVVGANACRLDRRWPVALYSAIEDPHVTLSADL